MSGAFAGAAASLFFDGSASILGTPNFLANGTIVTSSTALPSNWFWPTTAAIGAGYWIRFTPLTLINGSGLNCSPQSVWTALSATVVCNKGAGGGTVLCLVEIATDSSGGSVVMRGLVGTSNTQ